MTTESTSLGPPAPDRPQLEGLRRDLLAMGDLWTRNWPQIGKIAVSGGAPRMALTDAVQDYYWRSYEHGAAAHILLQERRAIPFLTMLRALYETLVILNYLATHANPEREAQIAAAHDPIHEFWEYRTYGLSGEEDIVRLNEAKRRIQELPFAAEIIDAARARERHFSWTGLKFERLVAKRANRTEYRFLYGRLSALVHPHNRMLAKRAKDLPVEWYESNAKMCRIFLREVRSLAEKVLGIPLPDEWLDDAGFGLK